MSVLAAALLAWSLFGVVAGAAWVLGRSQREQGILRGTMVAVVSLYLASGLLIAGLAALVDSWLANLGK